MNINNTACQNISGGKLEVHFTTDKHTGKIKILEDFRKRFYVHGLSEFLANSTKSPVKKFVLTGIDVFSKYRLQHR